MTDRDRFERGLAIRREVVGEGYVDRAIESTFVALRRILPSGRP